MQPTLITACLVLLFCAVVSAAPGKSILSRAIKAYKRKQVVNPRPYTVSDGKGSSHQLVPYFIPPHDTTKSAYAEDVAAADQAVVLGTAAQ